VIDVDPEAAALRAALAKALSPAFRSTLVGLASPYGDGRSAARIVEALASVPGRERLLHKRFIMPPAAPPAEP
jgi:UDP-N-acetylglucosamine 2-epimerase